MKRFLLFFAVALLIVTTIAWLRYGGGDPYPDLSTTPLINGDQLEEFLAYPEPIGNVTVSIDGRVFFSVHPESRPVGNRVLEFVDGAALPFPDVETQLPYFDTVLGITVDFFGRLWVLDHGNHGLRVPRLFGFDIETGDLFHDEVFPEHIAPMGSYLQDLRVSSDGKTIVIADASLWRKSPALIVYDIESRLTRRVLEGHASVAAENYMIRSSEREMSFLGGVVSLRGGVDGIALGPKWLYYGATSGSGLYRVPLHDLRNSRLPAKQLAARVERIASRPLGSGFALDERGNLYIADVEHNGIFVVTADGRGRTLIRSDKIRWPESLWFGPGGWLYVTDSALPELMLRPPEHIRDQQPFRVFRFRPLRDNAAQSAPDATPR